ncbi:cytidine/deoxycytidylate deaminase family protein [Streptacidiphilus rugosus]|uniref:hypothetical protein n=1 Tax=Streptacidiphilus rugosus TaxID=405783 RepID=UPI0012F88B31|nr:hypothetical protein [Streptacidiphilus rugosus]
MGIDLAIRQALRSECRFRVGAVVASRGRVFAAAPNKRRNSPTIDFRHSTFHAEEAALRRVADASGREIYVARVGASGTPMLARPCPRCLKLLASAGIARAYYTIGLGLIGMTVPGTTSSPPDDAIIEISAAARSGNPGSRHPLPAKDHHPYASVAG